MPQAVILLVRHGRASSRASTSTRPRPRGAKRPSRAHNQSPSKQRAQGKPGARRTRSPLCNVKHRGRSHRYPGTPGISLRNGFNGLFRALPGDRALLPPSSADMFCLSPVGPTQLRELDASVGASGPHDFAVRSNISVSVPVTAHRFKEPALRSHRAQNAAASTASRALRP